VIRAAGERGAGRARASELRRGAHEWIAGGQWMNRRVAAEGRYDEWELSLERLVRLPGKASADARTAEAEEAVGEALVAVARRAAAVELLEAWLEWLTAEESAQLADALALDARADADAIGRRVEAGDAARVAQDGALAALAAAQREARLARMRAETARSTLRVRHPSLVLPDPAPRLPEPAASDWRQWVERLVEENPDLRVARGRAAPAARRAERAGLDRTADPTIGVRTFSERGGDETAVGVYVSVPLGAGPREALAAEAFALADAAAAEVEATRIEVQRSLEMLVAQADARFDAWRLAREVLVAQRDETARLIRARDLGAIDAATLLAARRREREAALGEVEARAAAWQATLRLLIEARALWAHD
jgi:outer membrane protein TolC